MATGTGNLPHPGKVYNPFDILTAEELNEDVANIESLADGTGRGDESITTNQYVPGSVIATTIDDEAITLDYEQLTSNTGITGTSYIDLSGLSLTVTVPTGGRYLRVEGFASTISTTSAENVVTLAIRDGSNNVVSSIRSNIRSGTNQSLGSVVYKRQLSAGSYTFKLSASRDVNTGTTTLAGSSSSPCFITADLM
jgi:hypothetical protein